jgi:hemolysin D
MRFASGSFEHPKPEPAEPTLERHTRCGNPTGARPGRTLLADLAIVRERAAALGQELRKAERRLEVMQLRAPVDGHVQELAATTIGGVVMPAQQLMIIVPADRGLEVEAFVLNKDIGFVQPGQEAQIKVQTFNFTRYGLLSGKVLDVSDDVVTRDRDTDEPAEPTYAARIALERATMEIDGREVKLSPGMAVTAEIRTGERRLIEYLLSPLLRYRHEAMKEH